MTITTNPARNEYTATAGQTVFSYTFKIYEDTDLNVYKTSAGAIADDITDLITAYTVTGTGSSTGGTITLSTPASAGDLITIVSDIPESRTTDYQNNGDFRPDVVNDDFDRIVSLVKQSVERSNRGLAFAEAQQGAQGFSLPTPEAGYFLRWNGALDGLENVPFSSASPGTTNLTVSMLGGITGQVSGDWRYCLGKTIIGDSGYGPFIWRVGDFTAMVASDPLSGVYAPSDADPTGASGCWVRQFDGPVQFAWFCKFNGADDDTAGMQAALDLGYASYEAPEGVCKLTDELTISKPMKFVGQGHINSSTMNFQGTLFWQTNAAKSILKLEYAGTSQDSYFAHFCMVSEGDGIHAVSRHRNTFEDIHAVGGMVGTAFLLDGCFENRLIACTATTNGYSAQSFTTGYTGDMARGYALIKDAASYGCNATELHGCIASGCGIGLDIGGATNTYGSVFGGTFEGNDINIKIDTVSLYNFYGCHIESPAGGPNTYIKDAYNVRMYGCDMGGGYLNQSLVIENSKHCRFVDMGVGYIDIDANCFDTEFVNCAWYPAQVRDFGINTNYRGTHSTPATLQYVKGAYSGYGSQNIIYNGNFDRWVDSNTPDECVKYDANTTLTQEATIVKAGIYSVLSEVSGGATYGGLKYSDIGDYIYSDWVSVSYWQYIPSTNYSGNYGIRIDGLSATALVWEAAETAELDTWVYKSYAVYVGEPGSTRRSGSAINVAIITGGGGGDGSAYISGVQIANGKSPTDKFSKGNAESRLQIIDGHKVIYGTSAPASGSYIIGDRCVNSAPAVGQPKAWTCTVTGSPGTWVSEGNL